MRGLTQQIVLAFGCVIALFSTRANAELRTPSMVVTLEVPDGREPEFVCVVTQNDCDPKKGCQTERLLPLYNAALKKTAAENTFTFERNDDAAIKKLREGDVREAITLLANRVYEPSCDIENRDLCRADLRLGAFRSPAGTDGQEKNQNATPTVGSFSCAKQRAAHREGAEKQMQRVAFIAVHLGPESIPAAKVSEIHLYGKTLSIDFDRTLPESMSASAQVIGGDYAFVDVGSGTVQHLRVDLIPRCGHVVVALPPHSTPVVSVAVDAVSCGAPKDAGAWNSSSRRLELEIPTQGVARVRKLTIEYAREADTTAHDSAARSASESEWSEALVPKQMAPGNRTVRFSWKRPTDCLADEWLDDVAPKQSRWNGRCPQATLAPNTTCGLITRSPTDVTRCDYACTVTADRDPVQLPVDVRFDRMRQNRVEANTPGETEVVYSWKDQVSSLGEELSSSVAAQDRRLFIELQPRMWTPWFGDRFDAIRVLVAQAQEQIDLTGEDGGALHSWYSLSTPGRTCSDRVRLAVFGTRKYSETTRALKTAQLSLSDPSTYRGKWQGYLFVGGGVVYRDFPYAGSPLGRIGIGLQLDLSYFAPLLGSLSFNLELAAVQLTKKFYRGIELPEAPKSTYQSVPYLRVDVLRVGLEWWFWRRLGIGAMAGPGLGSPVYFTDDERVGAIQWSPSWDSYVIYTMRPHSVWLLLGGGHRLSEEHVDYRTDFLGQPAREITHTRQSQFFVHFRWMLP